MRPTFPALFLFVCHWWGGTGFVATRHPELQVNIRQHRTFAKVFQLIADILEYVRLKLGFNDKPVSLAWIMSISSALLQITFASVVLRICCNCNGVKMPGFSYLNLCFCFLWKHFNSPKSVSVSQSFELLANYAGKCRSDQCTRNHLFHNATNPQVQVTWMPVVRTQFLNNHRIFNVHLHFFPGFGHGQIAETTIFQITKNKIV